MDDHLVACPKQIPKFFANMLVHANPHKTHPWIFDWRRRGRNIQSYSEFDHNMKLGELKDILNMQREQIFGLLLKESTMPIVLSSAFKQISGPCTSSTHDACALKRACSQALEDRKRAGISGYKILLPLADSEIARYMS